MAKKQNDIDFLTDFIAIYKEHPSLWKIKSNEYSNRTLKEKGYNALIDLYNRYDIRNATTDTVKKKIQSMRASFRRQQKKMKTRSGMGGDELEDQDTTLWYYNLLLFTVDQEEPRQNIANDSSEEDEGEAEDDTVAERERNSNTPDQMPKRKKNTNTKLQDNRAKLLDKAYEVLAKDDEYDAYGVTVAAKLRKLSHDQRLYCENIINTALYKGALHQLTEETTLSISQPPRAVQNSFNINSIIGKERTSTNSFISLSSAVDRQRTEAMSAMYAKPGSSQNNNNSEFYPHFDTYSNYNFLLSSPRPQADAQPKETSGDNITDYFNNFTPRE